MEPLYCFKLNEETGGITKYTIPEYKKVIVSQFTGRSCYVFKGSLVNSSYKRYDLREEKIDKFVSCKLFTFNENEEEAFEKIRDTILDKLSELDKQKAKQSDIFGAVMFAHAHKKNKERGLYEEN